MEGESIPCDAYELVADETFAVEKADRHYRLMAARLRTISRSLQGFRRQQELDFLLADEERGA